MLFSILVVTLNTGEKLKNTLESVLCQSFTDFEVVIKDGGSTDDSFLLAEPFLKDPRVTVYNREDTGIYDAMNQAVQYAKGDYVYFLNCGDYLYDESVLAAVAEKLTQSADKRVILYGNLYNRATESFVTHAPVVDDFTCFRNVPCHQVCFYKRELYLEKSLNPEYRIRADYEHFLWCFYKGGASFVYLDRTLASYEGGGYSETKENKKRSKKEHKRITREYIPKNLLRKYRLIMLCTLAPLRSRLADSKAFGRFYNRLRDKIYGK